MLMCKINNSVYPEDIKDILTKLMRDLSFSWDCERKFLDNLSEADFKSIYGYRGKLVGTKVVHLEMDPKDLDLRFNCVERLCYVKDGKLTPVDERQPETYQEKLGCTIAMHEDLPVLYAGDEIIVIIGVSAYNVAEAVYIINLTNKEYKPLNRF